MEEWERLFRAAYEADPTTSQRLWESYCHGDDEAFRQLLAYHGGDLWRACWNRCRPDSHAAADLFQDVVVWLATRRRSSPSVTWEATFAQARVRVYHLAVNRYHATSARRRREERVARKEAATDQPMTDEERGTIHEAVNELSPNLRAVVALIYWEGLNIQDTAKALGKNRDTVAAWLTKAQTILKSRLAPASVAGMISGAVSQSQAAAPPQPLSELVSAALTRVPVGATWMWGVAAGLFLVTASGLGGWAMTRPVSTPPVAETPPPTLTELNRSVFSQDIQPEIETEFRKLLLGQGGSVQTLEVSIHGTRVGFVLELRHGPPLQNWVMLWYVVYDTHTRDARYYFDRFGDGQYHLTRPDRPIQLFRDDTTGLLPPLNLKLIPYKTATNAFGRLPVDPRSAGEYERTNDEIRQRLRTLQGVWYRNSDPNQPIRATLQSEPDIDLSIREEFGERKVLARQTASLMWIGKSGQLERVFDTIRCELSADRQRLTLTYPRGEFWTRRPK